MGILTVIRNEALVIDGDFIYYSKNHEKDVPLGYIAADDLLLINGDNDSRGVYIDTVDIGEDKYITISFRCLARFFNKGKDPSKQEIIDALESVDIIDYTEDDQKQASKSPGFGYVRTWGNNWHRSASVLFIVDPNLYILMGVDDDQYFGCSFAAEDGKPVTNLQSAYKMLMPKHIRETPADKINRQGEWFFVKLDGEPNNYVGAEKVIYNCSNVGIQHILKSRNNGPTSNHHVVMSEELWFVNDTFKINGGNKVPVFYRPSIYHNQHPELNMEGYWWPIENTAIQSFSEEGVD
jgi:hypothetical protein